MSWLVTVIVPADRAVMMEVMVEVIVAELWDLGTTGVLERPAGDGSVGAVEVVAGFDDHDEARTAAVVLGRHHPSAAQVTIEAAPPLETWIDPAATAEVALGNGDRFTIRPGAAFGHGAHPTTSLLADLAVDLLRSGPTDPVVLDMGSGTGVLSVVALRNDAGRVIAVDTDPAAVAATTANLTDLGLIDRATVIEGPVDAVDAADLATVDLVLANVLLPVHRLIAPLLDAQLPANAVVATSGYLTEQADELVSLYTTGPPARATSAMRTDHEQSWLAHAFAPT